MKMEHLKHRGEVQEVQGVQGKKFIVQTFLGSSRISIDASRWIPGIEVPQFHVGKLPTSVVYCPSLVKSCEIQWAT